jgi:Fe-coproporphyrin III synthase
VHDLLLKNGGNNSGIRIGAVDEKGDVHPDQFWQHYSLGNVSKTKFGDIWSDESEPLLGMLRHRKQLLKGRCSKCKFIEMCNGNLRVRSEAIHNDLWEADPACYLSDEEIGL